MVRKASEASRERATDQSVMGMGVGHLEFLRSTATPLDLLGDEVNARIFLQRLSVHKVLIRYVIEEWSRKVADAAERITRSRIVIVVVLALLL